MTLVVPHKPRQHIILLTADMIEYYSGRSAAAPLIYFFSGLALASLVGV